MIAMGSTMKGDDRKQEFMAVALNLFYEKGYEKTTIKDIIEGVGLTKGAFYHYFVSKEDLLESIAKEYAKRALQIIRDIAKREDLTALEKINELVEAVNAYKGREEEKRAKIKGVFIHEENLKLERRISKALRDSAVGYFEEIIESGVLEGTIETSSPRDLAEFTLFLISHLNGSMDELIQKRKINEEEWSKERFIHELERKLSFFEEIFSKVFSFNQGEIHLREPYIRRFTGR